MSCTAGHRSSLLANTHKVVWFAPDRPVEGNTIFVRPLTNFEAATEHDSTEASSKMIEDTTSH